MHDTGGMDIETNDESFKLPWWMDPEARDERRAVRLYLEHAYDWPLITRQMPPSTPKNALEIPEEMRVSLARQRHAARAERRVPLAVRRRARLETKIWVPW